LDATKWVGNIELAAPLVIAGVLGIGWLWFRKRPAAWVRNKRALFVFAAVICIQVILAHRIYMRGFDHGNAGQLREEAYVSFFHGASYIGRDLHLYDNPFSELLGLFALNAVFLWLLAREQREAEERMSVVNRTNGQGPPGT
jgi:hypothetical protein